MTSKSFNIHVISGSEDGLSLILLVLNATAFNKETEFSENWKAVAFQVIFNHFFMKNLYL